MENHEDQIFPAEPQQEEMEHTGPIPVPEPEPIPETAYRGTGTGRKESPFADSPYVMQNPSREVPGQERPYAPQYAAPRKARAKKTGLGKKILAAVLALMLVASSCGVTALLLNRYWTEQTDAMRQEFARQIQALQTQIEENSPSNTGISVSGSAVYADGSLSPSQIYAKNADAVVLILSTVSYNYYGQTGTSTSSGSGFFLTSDGYILTNYHVVEGADRVSVTLSDGSEHAAAMVGGDQINDVALLKIEGSNFPCVSVGSSDDLIVGDQVVCIGNPLGELTNSLTVGYISAKDRDVTTDGTQISMMQTDVAINSGNSGGPLFNMKGEVVGITTAKYSGESSSGASIEGIGFAIPMDDVMSLVSDLKEFGYVKGAYMGVTISDMDSQLASLAKIYGFPVGPIIQSVEANGAAALAGIQVEDIVVKLGSKEVSTVTELTRELRNYDPGDTTTIRVYRDGNILDLKITFGERPADVSANSVPQETMPSEEQQGGYGWNPFSGWGGGN